MRAWGKVLAQANAEWKFAPPDGFDFFRPRGWSTTVRRPFFVEARRLGRESDVPHAWVLGTLSSVSGGSAEGWRTWSSTESWNQIPR
jgi:hypothetical protein